VIAQVEGLPVDHALEQAVQRRPVFKPLPWQVSALHAWVHQL
jgi:hypothetical protein